MKNNYTVSVRLMTYMHASFIKDAMDGIMMQKTDFKVEVVVGDDFSTDGTLDIIRNYSDTDHIHIKILEREKGDAYWQKRQELGRLYNFINILENCKGKYIAILDGDDYWTDPLKLQKQVDFLELNESYSMIFSDINLVDENGLLKQQNTLKNYKEVFSQHDFPFYCPSPTRVHRNLEFYKNLHNVNLKGLDTLMLANLSRIGKVKFLRQSTSNYRVHKNGVWNSMNSLHKYSEYINTHLICLDFIDSKSSKKNLIEISKRLLKIKKISSRNFDVELKRVKKKYLNIISKTKLRMNIVFVFEIILKLPLKDSLKIKIIRKLVNI